MKVWTVWIDRNGKWHSSEEIGAELVGSMPWAEEASRRFAQRLMGLTKGTASYIGTARAAFCVHARTRSQALGLAKKAYERKLLEERKDN